MAPWYPGETTLSLTEAEALDSMLDSSALPGSAFTEVARELGENAEKKLRKNYEGCSS